jgi:alpha-1,6-mannosyltransferase
VPVPGANGYRFPVARARVVDTLLAIAPDVIEAGDPFVCGWAAREAARRLAVPAFAFCHSDLQTMLARRFGSTAGKLARAYLRRLYEGFDGVLAASAGLEALLRENGLGNVARQPLGVDTRIFAPGRRDPGLRERLGLASSTRLLAFAGRFGPEKRLDVVSAVLERLGSPYVLVAVGDGSRPPHGANVVRLSYLADPRELAALLATCDAFLHLGDQETFGLAVLEALACGLPVIGSDRGGVAELIDEEVGIRVPATNVDAVVDAVRNLFAGNRLALGANARARAVARHDWTAVLPALAARYHAACGHDRRGAVIGRAPDGVRAALDDTNAPASVGEPG